MARSLPMLVFMLTVVSVMPGFAQGRRGGPGRGPLDRPRQGSLELGDPAPDFELSRLGGKENETVKLSSFKGKQPVVLIFGSYT